MKYNISDIVQKIIWVEKKYNIFQEKIEDIYFWKLLRVDLLNEVAIKKGLYDKAHSNLKKSKRVLVINICLNLLKKYKNKQTLIFSHNRFFIDNNKYKDIHTFELWDNLNAEIIYPAFTDFKVQNKDYQYSTFDTLGYVFNRIKNSIFYRKVEINRDINYKINNLRKELEEYFDLIELENLKTEKILERVKKFKSDKKYDKAFLKSKNPKQIYIVCSYGKESLILAAQELGIKVIEVQHGVINKYHLAYHYPFDKNIPYFPHEILLFGKYWSENIKIPLKKEAVKYSGYPYLKNQLNKYVGVIKENQDQVLFVSQGSIGKKLTEIAIDFAKKNTNKKVVIRLHPGEFSRWKIDYEILYKNRKLPNVFISDNNEINMYEYLFESKYIICVYSTVIYEAIYLKKRVGIINLPGVENIEDLVESKHVYKYDISSEIDLKKLESLNQENLNIF